MLRFLRRRQLMLTHQNVPENSYIAQKCVWFIHHHFPPTFHSIASNVHAKTKKKSFFIRDFSIWRWRMKSAWNRLHFVSYCQTKQLFSSPWSHRTTRKISQFNYWNFLNCLHIITLILIMSTQMSLLHYPPSSTSWILNIYSPLQH